MVYHLSFPEVCQHNTWRETFLFDTLINFPYDLGQFTKFPKICLVQEVHFFKKNMASAIQKPEKERVKYESLCEILSVLF